MADESPDPEHMRTPTAPDADHATGDAPPASLDTPETPGRLMIGVIGAPHGVRGELRVRIISDFPERIPDLNYVYLGDETEPRRLRDIRLGADNFAILRVGGISGRDEAAAQRGQPLYMDIRDAKPLEEGEYYWHQLIDMTVVTPEGETLGTLTSIMQTGANDVYTITQPDGKELLLPALKDVILDIDVPNKRMIAKPLEFL